MALYPTRALERAMRIQEVMLRAIGKEMSWIQAAEIIGVRPRTMRRWRQRYEEFGYDGLYDRRWKGPSPKRVPLATVEKVLRLYREQYDGFNVVHFVEKLHEVHDIQLSYSWVKKALQEAGLVARKRRKGPHRKRRPRRPLQGMLLHVDGSQHRWLPGQAYQDLIVVFDDADSEVYYAQLVPEESTATVMAALQEVVEQHGVFCSLYADRASHMVHTPRAGGAPDRTRLTQIGRALEQLGADLEKIFSRQETRVVAADNTVSYSRRTLQIERQEFRYSLARCKVLVCEHLDGTLSLHYGHHRLGHYDAQGQPLGSATEAA